MLTFVDFLIECIECQEFETIKQMADVDYRVELRRVPSFYEKVNAICEKYFNQGIKKQNQMQAMLSSILGGGGGASAQNSIGGRWNSKKSSLSILLSIGLTAEIYICDSEYILSIQTKN